MLTSGLVVRVCRPPRPSSICVLKVLVEVVGGLEIDVLEGAAVVLSSEDDVEGKMDVPSRLVVVRVRTASRPSSI